MDSFHLLKDKGGFQFALKHNGLKWMPFFIEMKTQKRAEIKHLSSPQKEAGDTGHM